MIGAVIESDIAVYVTVDALFPGQADTEAALLAALEPLSRDDTLFTCARINALVSGFAPERSLHERQKAAVSMLCSQEQKMALSRFVSQRGGPNRVMVFFRGQILELSRWVAVHCKNRPGDGGTFADPNVCSAFVRAALIASALWQRRLFGPEGFIAGRDPRELTRRALGAIRKSVEEGNQTSHPGFSTSRGWLLFSRYMPAHLPDFDKMFEQATGLTLRQYFVSAFALLDRTFSDCPEAKRMFATDYVQGDTPFRQTFAKFIALQSQSPEDWSCRVQSAPNESGYRSLREHPIFSFAGNRSIIFDPTFYMDSLTASPLFHVRAAGIPINQLFGAFGYAFEDYARDLLRQRFPGEGCLLHRRLRCGVRGANARHETFEVDAIVNDIEAIIVFEMKAAWIREENVLADPDVFLNEVRSRYGHVADSPERPKAVAQLARSIGALARREWSGPDRDYAHVRTLYPVLTTFDARMGVPGMGQFLDEEFRERLGPIPTDVFVHRLIVLTIGDLEHLVSGIESLSLREFLHAYSAADPERVGSVHNFLATSAYLNQVKVSPLLESLGEEFMAAVRAELFADAT